MRKEECVALYPYRRFEFSWVSYFDGIYFIPLEAVEAVYADWDMRLITAVVKAFKVHPVMEVVGLRWEIEWPWEHDGEVKLSKDSYLRARYSKDSNAPGAFWFRWNSPMVIGKDDIIFSAA